jgi:uncharacterized protein YndB with AHSA1/START domain
MWRKPPFLIAGVLLAAVVCVQLRPGRYRTERSIELATSPEVVYRRISDLRQWQRWSPWNELDLQVQRKYEGPRQGLGATYSWDGKGAIGQGKVTITEAEEPLQVVYRVEFIAPWHAVVENTFLLKKTVSGVKLTWSVAGERHFWSKLFGLLSDADQVLGADMERGLATLQKLVVRAPSS